MNINETQGSGDSLNVTKTPRIEPKNTKKDSFWWEFVKYALIAVFIILPIRMYVIQPFIVSGQSMEYTFDSGEYLLVDEISYRFNNPQRGDVIVFKYPNDTSKYFIKRIIGLPGETIKIQGDSISIFNKDFPKGYVLKETYISDDFKVNQPNAHMEITLDSTHYFVMGDNRKYSSDSRVWGPLDKKFITGRPLVRLASVKSFKESWFPINYISPSKMGPYPGEHREIYQTVTSTTSATN